MYGYIVINKPELKFKEFDRYRSYYCGLCDVLRKNYGFGGQISISYDMTFLIVLLSGLYEPDTMYFKDRCIAHPVVKHQVRKNAITDYVADMNILMTYYKCMDDWKDEHKVTRRTYAASLKNRAYKVMTKYKQKATAIKEALELLSKAECDKETNIDRAAGCFGTVMAEMTSMKEDEWRDDLYQLGFALGKFIYLMDAYEDLDGDMKAGRYNVLTSHMDNPDFDVLCQNILNTLMAECARQFEKLPIIQDAEILRNIIYSGVWTRFGIAREKRAGKQEK